MTSKDVQWGVIYDSNRMVTSNNNAESGGFKWRERASVISASEYELLTDDSHDELSQKFY